MIVIEINDEERLVIFHGKRLVIFHGKRLVIFHGKIGAPGVARLLNNNPVVLFKKKT
jgi:hypothetical protein